MKKVLTLLLLFSVSVCCFSTTSRKIDKADIPTTGFIINGMTKSASLTFQTRSIVSCEEGVKNMIQYELKNQLIMPYRIKDKTVTAYCINEYGAVKEINLIKLL